MQRARRTVERYGGPQHTMERRVGQHAGAAAVTDGEVRVKCRDFV